MPGLLSPTHWHHSSSVVASLNPTGRGCMETRSSIPSRQSLHLRRLNYSRASGSGSIAALCPSRLRPTWNRPGNTQTSSHSESEYLQNELSLGRMLGPFTETDDLPSLQVNRFGVIPKGHNSGKWRLITDLSYPPGQSVNEGIDPALCSMAYTTVDR